jgi:hypothetical protein
LAHAYKDSAADARLDRLSRQNKRLIDTIKMIAYRAETARAQIVRQKMSRHDDARSPEWQAQVSDWLLRSGCRCMMAWGRNCGDWNTSGFSQFGAPDQHDLLARGQR